MKKRCHYSKGFTLSELMVAVFIMSVAFLGILLSFVRCMELNETSQKISNALSAAQSQMEDIRNTDLNQLVTTYHGVAFSDASEFPNGSGIGVSYIDNSVSDLFVITVSFCWRQNNGRVIGEDLDLDGILDAGEDKNGNGMIDSTVQLVTSVFNE